MDACNGSSTGGDVRCLRNIPSSGLRAGQLTATGCRSYPPFGLVVRTTHGRDAGKGREGPFQRTASGASLPRFGARILYSGLEREIRGVDPRHTTQLLGQFDRQLALGFAIDLAA